MGFRFRRSVRLGKGVRLNLSKSGVSMSLGGRGATVSLSRRGVYGTAGLPGTGLSYRAKLSGSAGNVRTEAVSSGVAAAPAAAGLLGCFGILTLVVALGLLLAGSTGPAILFGTITAAIGLGIRGMNRRAAEERAAAEERVREAARAREEALIGRFGRETAARLIAGEIWIEQTAEQVREALGDPEEVEEKILKTKQREVWKYGRTGVNRFTTRITLDDGVVASWQRK